MPWTFYKENICADNVVAKFTNNNGHRVCDIYEGRDGYYSVDHIKGIQLDSVKYSTARTMNSAEEEQGDTTEVLFASLKHACQIFEEDYHKQASALVRVLEVKS